MCWLDLLLEYLKLLRRYVMDDFLNLVKLLRGHVG